MRKQPTDKPTPTTPPPPENRVRDRSDLPDDETIAAAYRAGSSTTELARRWGCSPNTVSARLRNAGITLRPPGRQARLNIPARTVVKLREEQQLTWSDIAQQMEVSTSTVRTAYLSVRGDHTDIPLTDPGPDDTAQNSPSDPTRQPDTLDPTWTIGEEQRQLETWAPGRHPAVPNRTWCTQTEAATILGVSRGQVYRMVYELGVLQPWYAAGGRLLLRRSNVETAAHLAGPEGTADRWQAARAAVGSPQLPPKPRTRAGRQPVVLPAERRVNQLPWEEIVAAYRSGTSSRELADRHNITVATLRRRLKAHGVQLPDHPPRLQLPLSDAELARRHAAGVSAADLADLCGVSTITIYRHLRTHY